MDEEYTTIIVTIMDSGAVKVKEMGEMVPTHYDSIDEAMGAIEKRLISVKMQMHFETEHDSMEGP